MQVQQLITINNMLGAEFVGRVFARDPRDWSDQMPGGDYKYWTEYYAIRYTKIDGKSYLLGFSRYSYKSGGFDHDRLEGCFTGMYGNQHCLVFVDLHSIRIGFTNTDSPHIYYYTLMEAIQSGLLITPGKFAAHINEQLRSESTYLEDFETEYLNPTNAL